MTQPYEVSWTPDALRAVERLPEKGAAAVLELIHGPLAGNPHRLGRPLRLNLSGLHAARRGPYRVVYEIDEARHRVRVPAIEHRSDIYRRR